MAASAEAIRRTRNIIQCYNCIFHLNQPRPPSHSNYRYDDGSYSHAFLCTDLMKPRTCYRNPNTLSCCRVIINSDGSLN